MYGVDCDDRYDILMYKVGYSDSKAFRSTFKKFTGLSPAQYRNKQNRTMSFERL